MTDQEEARDAARAAAPEKAPETASRAVRATLPVQLMVALLVALLTIALFLTIALELTRSAVTGSDILVRADTRVLAFMRAHATADGDRLMSFISLIGSPLSMGVLAVAGVLWLWSRKRIIPLVGWCCSFIGASALTVGLKHLFQRVRPDGATAFLHGTSFSFPSGHALGSLVGIGITTYLLIAFRESRRLTRVLTAATGVCAIAAIGWSRLYLGVHYLSDVVAGFAAGAVWLSCCIAGIEYYRHVYPNRAAHPTAR